MRSPPGTYAGLRPGSDASPDYQIARAPGRAPWVTVGGIRSTGLTAALGIARRVARLCDEALDEAAPAGDERGGARDTTTTPLPPVDAIVRSFRERGDGSVVFGDDAAGFGAHRVTHPLTRLGFERLAAAL